MKSHSFVLTAVLIFGASCLPTPDELRGGTVGASSGGAGGAGVVDAASPGPAASGGSPGPGPGPGSGGAPVVVVPPLPGGSGGMGAGGMALGRGGSGGGGAAGMGGMMSPPGMGGMMSAPGMGGMMSPPGMGGAGGSSVLVAQTRVQACAIFAALVARKTKLCNPYLIDSFYGTEDAYRQRREIHCGLYNYPAVNWPLKNQQICVDAFNKQACDLFLNDGIPEPCLPAGAFAEGISCLSGDQCATDFCLLPASGCGRCTRAPVEGQRCDNGVCARTLECNAQSICVAPRILGQPCNVNLPCQGILTCRAGTCVARGAAGAPCDTGRDCATWGSLLCNLTTKRCVPVQLSSTNACGFQNNGALYLGCPAGGTCVNNVCIKPAADGAACDEDDGPDCTWPAQCSDVSATCRFPMSNLMCGTPAAAGLRSDLPELLPPTGRAARDRRGGVDDARSSYGM